MKLSPTIIENKYLLITFLIVIVLTTYLLSISYKKPISYKEQAIERINLDSLKNKMYEQVKDSVHTADSIYLQSLSKMSKTELQSEFNKKFPR